MAEVAEGTEKEVDDSELGELGEIGTVEDTGRVLDNEEG
jgi:hypothetical protein